MRIDKKTGREVPMRDKTLGASSGGRPIPAKLTLVIWEDAYDEETIDKEVWKDVPAEGEQPEADSCIVYSVGWILWEDPRVILLHRDLGMWWSELPQVTFTGARFVIPKRWIYAMHEIPVPKNALTVERPTRVSMK